MQPIDTDDSAVMTRGNGVQGLGGGGQGGGMGRSITMSTTKIFKQKSLLFILLLSKFNASKYHHSNTTTQIP